MLNLAILGSTGSIGRQALAVVAQNPDRYRVVALCAHSNLELLDRQAAEFRPAYVGVTGAVPGGGYFPDAAVLTGPSAMEELAALPEVDAVLYATSGCGGLRAVLAGIKTGKRVMLANKETLVSGGGIIMPYAEERGVRILPVDSEHSAIFQCLEGSGAGFSRLILTASGGAFRDVPICELERMTAEQALRHPNWSMGRKITVDCATMANKGLEIIEAHWLFGAEYSRIDCVLHRESVVHSLVEFADGSVKAGLSHPSMELPIALALSYPDRLPSRVPRLDLAKLGALRFSAVDPARYPCLGLIVEAGKKGGLLPAAASAANDALVEAFLDGKIGFTDVAKNLERVLSALDVSGGLSVEAVEDAAARAWIKAAELIRS